MSCRLCHAELRHTFTDLGMSPPCEAFVPQDKLSTAEVFFPLHVFVCEECLLVQLPEHISPQEIFT